MKNLIKKLSILWSLLTEVKANQWKLFDPIIDSAAVSFFGLAPYLIITDKEPNLPINIYSYHSKVLILYGGRLYLIPNGDIKLVINEPIKYEDRRTFYRDKFKLAASFNRGNENVTIINYLNLSFAKAFNHKEGIIQVPSSYQLLSPLKEYLFCSNYLYMKILILSMKSKLKREQMQLSL